MEWKLDMLEENKSKLNEGVINYLKVRRIKQIQIASRMIGN